MSMECGAVLIGGALGLLTQPTKQRAIPAGLRSPQLLGQKADSYRPDIAVTGAGIKEPRLDKFRYPGEHCQEESGSSHPTSLDT